jgi:hypothetical protein
MMHGPGCCCIVATEHAWCLATGAMVCHSAVARLCCALVVMQRTWLLMSVARGAAWCLVAGVLVCWAQAGVHEAWGVCLA